MRSPFAFPAGARAFAIDEYRWPDPAHPGTNAAFFREHWPPGTGGIPAVDLPRCDALDSEAEIAAYCRRIADAGGFDVVVLGIGSNGHIAFNEPGSARDAPCRVVALAVETRRGLSAAWDPLLVEGLTVGVREIMDARHVIPLASGRAKRRILHAALTGPITSDLPASYLQEHPHVTVVYNSDAWVG